MELKKLKVKTVQKNLKKLSSVISFCHLWPKFFLAEVEIFLAKDDRRRWQKRMFVEKFPATWELRSSPTVYGVRLKVFGGTGKRLVVFVTRLDRVQNLRTSPSVISFCHLWPKFFSVEVEIFLAKDDRRRWQKRNFSSYPRAPTAPACSQTTSDGVIKHMNTFGGPSKAAWWSSKN